jgi:hypothetical protein
MVLIASWGRTRERLVFQQVLGDTKPPPPPSVVAEQPGTTNDDDSTLGSTFRLSIGFGVKRPPCACLVVATFCMLTLRPQHHQPQAWLPTALKNKGLFPAGCTTMVMMYRETLSLFFPEPPKRNWKGKESWKLVQGPFLAHPWM